jgi:uncharacterized glyoxalase superfamily metalloenzyme YdcJ
VREALETFRWNGVATETYNRLNDAHRLIADVVSFKGHHINHLTPRTLDIDAAQAEMPKRGIAPKAVIEGPPRRKCAILLRQTSFKALEEAVAFKNAAGATLAGAHTARFGEIEQRGAALTPKGRKIYDELLASVRGEVQVGSSGANADYAMELAQRFKTLPDDWSTLRAEGLAFFGDQGRHRSRSPRQPSSVDRGANREWISPVRSHSLRGLPARQRRWDLPVQSRRRSA